MNIGIMTLAEIVYAALDDDDNFTGTSYDNPDYPKVNKAAATMGRTIRIGDEQSPRLMRKLIVVYYTRVRVGGKKRPNYRELVMGVKEKLLLHPDLKPIFQNRVVLIDDETDPTPVSGKNTSYPWIGVHDSDLSGIPSFSHMRTETVAVEVWVYNEKYPRDVELTLIGE